MERAAEVFKKGPSTAEKELKEKNERVAQLERKIGQLTYKVDWLKKNLKKLSDPTGRKDFINRNNRNISVKRQAELLSVNRTSVYRPSPAQKQISDEELFVMRRIDEIHTYHPTWGYRTITRILRRDDHLFINRKRVRPIMRDMGIYKSPNFV